MYLSKLSIKDYKTFNEVFETQLNKGLTLFIGENGTGKTSIIDAIRVILNEDEYGRIGIRSSDFHRPINKPAKEKGADSIEIKATFEELNPKEQVALLPWLDAKDNKIAYLNIKIDNKEDPRGKFKRIIWGGESISSIFEWELISKIVCIYLPPLRDAENKLDALRGSRLSRLFRDEKPKPGDPEHELVKEFKDFNERLSKNNSTIKNANKDIKNKLKESLGQFLGQDALIQFSETSFERIVEKLRLLFYPTISNKTPEYFREISENSMGYNNILYLATVLAELERTKDSIHKIILIEEPEAHLHPQLQIRLLQYLYKQALESNIQIIVTSHSATIAASVKLDSINVLTLLEKRNPKSTLLKKCKIDDKQSKYFLERWLDITKSILFFAKGLIFVEGISEALVIKELSKKIVKEATKEDANPLESLEDCGVSIININGINFRNFFKLFQGYILKDEVKTEVDYIPVLCAGITDCDPIPVEDAKPTSQTTCPCGNSQSFNYAKELIDNKSLCCRIFTNLKTFEYDLAMASNNLSVMYKIIEEDYKNDCEGKRKAKEYSDKDWTSVSEDEKKEVCFELLNNVKDMKGEFGQKLAYKLSNEPDLSFSVPKYIKDAVLWAIGK
jgi:putative ATP-dependent endonuclease of the OLD family